MESIYNNFLIELKQLEKNYRDQISNSGNIIKNKDTEILTYKEKCNTLDIEIARLNEKITDLTEEANNFNKVSLLRKLHVKYDKVNHKNSVLKKRVNYYKNKLLKNNIHMDETIDLTKLLDEDTTDKDIESVKSSAIKQTTVIKKEVVVKKEKITETQEEVKKIEKKTDLKDTPVSESEEEDFEEVDVELIKIKKRFYYSEVNDNETVIYKATKIKKGEYDLGDRLGILVDNKLVKD